MALFLSNKVGVDDNHLRQEESRVVTSLLNVVVLLSIVAVAYTDWIVVANISLGYLYVLPLALSALVNPLPLTIFIAAGCTFLSDIFGPPHESLHLRLTHNSIMLVGFLIVSILVWLIARQRDRLTAEVRRQRD